MGKPRIRDPSGGLTIRANWRRVFDVCEEDAPIYAALASGPMFQGHCVRAANVAMLVREGAATTQPPLSSGLSPVVDLYL
jgi:hypothetical protein